MAKQGSQPGAGPKKPAKPASDTVSTPVGTGAAEGVETTGKDTPMTGTHGRTESETKPE